MIEITDDLTTCTKSYLLNHIKQYRPFTVKYNLDDKTVIYPINIVSNSNKNLFNFNKIYSNALLSLIYVNDSLDKDYENILATSLEYSDISNNFNNNIPLYYTDAS